MKKSLLTTAIVLGFAFTINAQDDKKAPIEKKETKKQIVNPDGTTSTVGESKSEESSTKKSGTRMAINEKGTSGTKSTTNKKESAKEEKNDSPVNKPH